MIGAVHVPPALSTPLALVVAAILVWYWRLLRGAPEPRRRVRRMSLAIMLATLANLLAGLSFLDPAVHARTYVASWTVSILLLMMVLVTALIDVLVTWRLHNESARDELHRAGEALARELRARRAEGRTRPSDARVAEAPPGAAEDDVP